jgi:hypothetical protein
MSAKGRRICATISGIAWRRPFRFIDSHNWGLRFVRHDQAVRPGDQVGYPAGRRNDCMGVSRQRIGFSSEIETWKKQPVHR